MKAKGDGEDGRDGDWGSTWGTTVRDRQERAEVCTEMEESVGVANGRRYVGGMKWKRTCVCMQQHVPNNDGPGANLGANQPATEDLL